jgi:hypothetical protein
MDIMKYIYITLLVFTVLSRSLYANGSQQTVAIMDFKVDPKSHKECDWLGKSMSDLLNDKLAQSGVRLLDRDSIAFALRERNLDTTYQSDAMLGAHKLIHGALLIDQSGQFSLSATLTSTSESEVLATHLVKGQYPQDFEKSINTITSNLLPVISKGLSPVAAKNTTSPEALGYFYRGVNYCAKGAPELGWFCFVTAFDLDKSFRPAKVWEMRAYQMMGFDDHADIVRQELISLKWKRTQSNSLIKQNGNYKVVAMTDPIIHSSNNVQITLVPQIKTLLQKKIIATKGMHLLDTEGVNHNITEFDLHLKNFDLEQTPKYQRWLHADLVVFTNIYPNNDGIAKVEISIIDVLSGKVLGRRSIKTQLTDKTKLEVALSDTLELVNVNEKTLGPSANQQLLKKGMSSEHEYCIFKHKGWYHECCYLNQLRKNEYNYEARFYLLRSFMDRIRHGQIRKGNEFFKKHAVLELEKFDDVLSKQEQGVLEAYWVYKVYRQITEYKYVFSNTIGFSIYNGQVRKAWDKKVDHTIKKYQKNLLGAALSFLRGSVYWYEKNKDKQCIEYLLQCISTLDQVPYENKDYKFFSKKLHSHYMVAKKYTYLNDRKLASYHFIQAKKILDLSRTKNKPIASLEFDFNLQFNTHNQRIIIAKTDIGHKDEKYGVEGDILKSLKDGKINKSQLMKTLNELKHSYMRISSKKKGIISIALQKKAMDAMVSLKAYVEQNENIVISLLNNTRAVLSTTKDFSYPLMILRPTSKKKQLLSDLEYQSLVRGTHSIFKNNMSSPETEKDEFSRQIILAHLYYISRDSKAVAQILDEYLINSRSVYYSNQALLNLVGTYGVKSFIELDNNLIRLKKLKKKLGESNIHWKVNFQFGIECMKMKRNQMAYEFFDLVMAVKNPNGANPVYLYPQNRFKDIKLSCRLYMAQILIEENEWSKAAEELRAIVAQSGGEKRFQNTGHGPYSMKIHKETKLVPIDLKAQKILDTLRMKLPTE